MAVPAHDERDYAFATKFGLNIIPVIEGGDVSKEAYSGDGVHINSDFLNGMNKQDAIAKMISWIEEKGIGTKKVNYKLRDWVFSRQRYWGEPIPVVYDENGKAYILPESDLPLVLPELEDYSPSKSGDSPLDKATNWVNTTFDGKNVKRETSTMPGSAGSSWYFLRYIDPKNDNEFANQELLKHWMPVDLYVGGPEHAVGHLLYSRFWNEYLFDKGLSPVKEPFSKLRHQGMILGTNGEKMSKSKGNVINPDDMVKEYGADSLRIYEMFMGPIDAAKPWDPNGIDGSKKFLEKVWRLYVESNKIQNSENKNLEREYHYTVKKVTNDYETMNFNTAISQMTNEEIAADIISLIRRYAIGSVLISHEARIRKAVEKLVKAHKFSKQEMNWIKRMETYLMNESVLNVKIFDEDVRFKEQGGFKKIDKVFQNQLENIVLELNTYLYDDGGKTA